MRAIITLLCLLFFHLVNAEPQPWGIIVKGSQCTKFWAGDECNSYKVPTGWSELYGEIIKYRGKECKFSTGQEEACCIQLGLKFIKIKLKKDLSASQTEFCKSRAK